MDFRGHTSHPRSSAAYGETPPARLSATRMVIIEGNRTKAELLHYYCTRHWGFEVAGLELTCSDGVAAVARHKPELVLASLAPSDLGLVEYVHSLCQAAPVAKVILLTTICNEYQVQLLASTGHHGLIFEADENLRTLALAIERVRLGMRFVSNRIVQCQTALRTNPTSFHKLLTARELEVLVCIAHSMTDEEIGHQFGVSASTAASHHKRIMTKLGIHSTPKLIRYCTDKGFNSVPPPLLALPPRHP